LDQVNGSIDFQTPAVTNRIATPSAATWLATVFHDGNSSDCGRSAILLLASISAILASEPPPVCGPGSARHAKIVRCGRGAHFGFRLRAPILALVSTRSDWRWGSISNADFDRRIPWRFGLRGW